MGSQMLKYSKGAERRTETKRPNKTANMVGREPAKEFPDAPNTGKVSRLRFTPPKKIPQAKPSRDGGIRSCKTRRNLLLPVVLDRDSHGEGKFGGQMNIIDTHASSHVNANEGNCDSGSD